MQDPIERAAQAAFERMFAGRHAPGWRFQSERCRMDWIAAVGAALLALREIPEITVFGPTKPAEAWAMTIDALLDNEGGL